MTSIVEEKIQRKDVENYTDDGISVDGDTEIAQGELTIADKVREIVVDRGHDKSLSFKRVNQKILDNLTERENKATRHLFNNTIYTNLGILGFQIAGPKKTDREKRKL